MTTTPVSAFKLAQIMVENKMEFRDDLCIDSSLLISKAPFKMVEKKGMSYTEVFFGDVYLRVQDGHKYEIPVSVKMFLDIEGYDPDVQDEMKNDFESLRYEAKMYKFIFENIIKPGYCANFISYISYGCCTIKSLTDVKRELRPLRMNNVLEAIHKITTRINSVNLLSSLKDFDFEKNKICMLITEKGGNGAIFGIPNAISTKSLYEIYNSITELDKLQIMFQIIYSVACMNLFRINHNDFHTNNILVSEFEIPIPMSFEIQGQIFAFETRYVPYLFDWDFAYSSLLGQNPKILSLKYMNIFYDFHPCKDLYTLFCYLKFEGPVASQYKQPGLEQALETTKKIFINRKQMSDILNKYNSFTNIRISDSVIGKCPVFKVKNKDLIHTMVDSIPEELQLLSTKTTIYFTTYTNLNGQYIFQFWVGYTCRWTTIDKDNLPTPVELLINKGIFEEFKSPSKNRFHYVLPTSKTLPSPIKREIERTIRDIESIDPTKPRAKALNKMKVEDSIRKMKNEPFTETPYYESD